METKIIVLDCPEVGSRQDRVLAEGMRAVWACALYACGADLFMADAAASTFPPQGRPMTHDRQPMGRAADARVTTRFVRGPGSLRINVEVERPGRSPFVRAGRTFRGSTAELQAMATTLHVIAQAVGILLPPDIGWRELTFADRAAAGLAHVVETGRDCLPDVVAQPLLN